MSAALAMNVSVEMRQMLCPSCGVSYSMPESLREKRAENGEPFWCPNGHRLSYTDSEAERLRKLLEAANRHNTELAGQVGAARAARDKAEKAKARLEKRVRAGVCPCCSRTFQNLARHMATKHPEKSAA